MLFRDEVWSDGGKLPHKEARNRQNAKIDRRPETEPGLPDHEYFSLCRRMTTMTMDKSLRMRSGLVRNRSVLTRAERIERLKAADRWGEGDSPFGLAKVRVYKLAIKKKKKKKEEETTEGVEGAATATDAKKETSKKETAKK